MLAIVKTIAERHRAQIALHDRDHGSGLVVRLTFPGV
jgi:nitrogen fixation/metabolism regulation signal transduction histidine kinase